MAIVRLDFGDDGVNCVPTVHLSGEKQMELSILIAFKATQNKSNSSCQLDLLRSRRLEVRTSRIPLNHSPCYMIIVHQATAHPALSMPISVDHRYYCSLHRSDILLSSHPTFKSARLDHSPPRKECKVRPLANTLS